MERHSIFSFFFKHTFFLFIQQLMVMQRGREETDFCVGQLREEVTSLQDMLNQARHQAEGQVSAKEDELLQVKMQLMQHQQNVSHFINTLDIYSDCIGILSLIFYRLVNLKTVAKACSLQTNNLLVIYPKKKGLLVKLVTL